MLNEEEIFKDEADKKTEEAVQAENDPVITANEPAPNNLENETPPMFQMNYKPESTAETIRKSGLAYSAAIALIGSVVFMLILGWILDTFMGTSPWCLVGGIVIGSLLGFYQFFKITSQILKNDD